MRGRFLAWRGRYREAAGAFGRGVGPRPIYADWVQYAAALILADDIAGYRKFCETIVEHMAHANGGAPVTFEYENLAFASWIPSLHPDSGVAARATLGWINEALKKNAGEAWVQHVSAAVAYRNGQYERAISLASISLNSGPNWWSAELNSYILALAHARLGHLDEVPIGSRRRRSSPSASRGWTRRRRASRRSRL